MNFKKLLALSCIGFAIPTGINGVTDAGWAMEDENENEVKPAGGKLENANKKLSDAWLMSDRPYIGNQNLEEASKKATKILSEMLKSGTAIEIKGENGYSDFEKWVTGLYPDAENRSLSDLITVISDNNDGGTFVMITEGFPDEIDDYLRLYNANLDLTGDKETAFTARIAKFKTPDGKGIRVIFKSDATDKWGGIPMYDKNGNAYEAGTPASGGFYKKTKIVVNKVQDKVVKINLPANIKKDLLNVYESFVNKISDEYEKRLNDLSNEINLMKLNLQNNNFKPVTVKGEVEGSKFGKRQVKSYTAPNNNQTSMQLKIDEKQEIVESDDQEEEKVIDLGQNEEKEVSQTIEKKNEIPPKQEPQTSLNNSSVLSKYQKNNKRKKL